MNWDGKAGNPKRPRNSRATLQLSVDGSVAGYIDVEIVDEDALGTNADKIITILAEVFRDAFNEAGDQAIIEDGEVH